MYSSRLIVTLLIPLSLSFWEFKKLIKAKSYELKKIAYPGFCRITTPLGWDASISLIKPAPPHSSLISVRLAFGNRLPNPTYR